MSEDSCGADVNGFNPFTGVLRFTGSDFVPGPLKKWNPDDGIASIASNFATTAARFGDTSNLVALTSNWKGKP